jgi:hypothetical protein
MLPSFWKVEIGNTLSTKVLFMLNSSSSIKYKVDDVLLFESIASFGKI